MSDFAFLKTGFSATKADDAPLPDADTLRVIVSVMRVLTNRTVESAERYARACGRYHVVGVDMCAALKYQAMTFFEADWDDEYAIILQEEQRHTYETDDEEEGEEEGDEEGDEGDEEGDEEGEEGDEGDEGEEEDEEEENVSQKCVVDGEDAAFHAQVTRCVAQWDAWRPTDPIKAMVRRAVEAADASVG